MAEDNKLYLTPEEGKQAIKLQEAGFNHDEIAQHFSAKVNQPTFNLTGESAIQAKKLREAGFTETDIAGYFGNKTLSIDNPVEIAKKEAQGGAISSGDLPGFWSKEGPVIAGATAGGMLGAKAGALTPIPGGAAIGGIVGAGIGGFSGALGAQKLTGMPIDIKDAALEGGLQAASQGTGELGLFTLKKLWPHIGKEYLKTDIQALGEKFAPYVDKYLPKSQRVSQGFLPYQIAREQSAAGKWQSIIESSFGGRKPMAHFRLASEQGAKEFADETASIVWNGVKKIPKEQLGKQTLNAYELAEDASNAVAKNLYNDVDKIATSNNIGVDYAPLKQYLESIKSGRSTGRSQMGDAAIDRVLSDIDEIKGIDTFMGAHDLRARIGKEINALERKDPGKMYMQIVKDKLTELMDAAAKNSSNPDLSQMYHRATRYYRGFSQRYKNDFMQSFADKAIDNPSIAVDMFVKADQPELVRYLYKATGGKNTQTAQNIQATLVEKWLQKASIEKGSEVATGEGGQQIGKTFYNQLKSMGSTLKEVFPDATVQRLWETAKILSTSQAKPTAAGGSMLVQLIQAGQLGTILGGIGVGGYKGATGESILSEESLGPMAMAGAALFTPRIISKLMIHPVYGKWFIEGMKPQRKWTYQTFQTVGKLMTAAMSYSMQDKQESKQKKTLESIPGQELKRTGGVQ